MLALQKSVVAKAASRRSVAAKATKFDEELVQTAVSRAQAEARSAARALRRNHHSLPPTDRPHLGLTLSPSARRPNRARIGARARRKGARWTAVPAISRAPH
jgi:hypothetical protein